MKLESQFRIGIDVGGTFTDLALRDDVTGEVRTAKVLTTPSNPWDGVRDGVSRLIVAGLDLRRVTAVIHGTTLVANALIERRGARVGLLTTQGFRDILHFVGRELRYDVYDPQIVFPEPLVPRALRREVRERVAGDGRVLEPLDVEDATRVVQGFLEEDVEAFAVCLLHSYLYPDHEQRLRDIIRAQASEIPISLSHEVLPQIREYERCSATAINAYVQPLMRHYLGTLRDGLREWGFRGELYLMTSSGGTITVETAMEFPLQLVESGPAAGTTIAAFLAKQMDVGNVMSFDMGGTTAKSCVIKAGRPLISKSHEVARVSRFRRGSGLPLGIPVIDLLEIGAGGGSIAEIDGLGLLRVGPRSASSEPGPVCYGRGGSEPTVTDANLVLGFINPEYFLGGELVLDVAGAQRAIEAKIARRLQLEVRQAAAAINRIVTENMAEAARVHAVEMNVDIRRFALVAFGGAGPIHAYGIAERLKLPVVICPPEAGVLSAVGLLVAPLAFEFSRSYTKDLEQLTWDEIAAILETLEARGRELLTPSGVAHPTFEHSVDMCYVGQGFEVTTPIPEDVLQRRDLQALKEAFDRTYAETFGRRLAELPARCVTWRVLARGPDPHFELQRDGRPGDARAALKGEREVLFPEYGTTRCAVYAREHLISGVTFRGPALIEETASTIVVPPTAEVEVDRYLNVIIHIAP